MSQSSNGTQQASAAAPPAPSAATTSVLPPSPPPTPPPPPPLDTPARQPSAPASSPAGSPARTKELLAANYLGVHELAVSQVHRTEFTRQLNALGLQKVKKSYEQRGWIDTHTPYVLLPREQLPSGKDKIFSPEVLGDLKVLCLDGNHRMRVLLDTEGPSFRIQCRLYLHFDCPKTVNALARSKSYLYSTGRWLCTYIIRCCMIHM